MKLIDRLKNHIADMHQLPRETTREGILMTEALAMLVMFENAVGDYLKACDEQELSEEAYEDLTQQKRGALREVFNELQRES